MEAIPASFSTAPLNAIFQRWIYSIGWTNQGALDGMVVEGDDGTKQLSIQDANDGDRQ